MQDSMQGPVLPKYALQCVMYCRAGQHSASACQDSDTCIWREQIMRKQMRVNG